MLWLGVKGWGSGRGLIFFIFFNVMLEECLFIYILFIFIVMLGVTGEGNGSVVWGLICFRCFYYFLSWGVIYLFLMCGGFRWYGGI